MKNRFFVILRDKKMIFKINDQSDIIEYAFTDLETYPNIPFYINIFETENIRKSIKPKVYENLNTISEKVLRPEIIVLLDDDTMGIERRAIEEFIRISLSPKNVYFFQQCTLTAPNNQNGHIVVSKSCRTLILSYIKDGIVLEQNFYDNKKYTLEELKELIRNLHPDCKFNNFDVYLNGSHLKEYSKIGEVIDVYELLNNAQTILLKTRL